MIKYVAVLMISYLKNDVVFENVMALYVLLSLLKTFKITFDRKGTCGALLTDLSKAFDVLSHNLLNMLLMTILTNIITKLESAYCQLIKWFDNNCMKANYDKFHLLIQACILLKVVSLKN